MARLGIGRRSVVAGVLAAAARPGPAVAAPESGAAPRMPPAQVLVASEGLVDTYFTQTVILLVRRGDQGALGIVLNRPIGSRSLASLLQAFGQDSAGVTGTVQVFSGGPVQPRAGFVVHSADYHRDDTIPIDAALSLTADAAILRDIGRGRGPRESLIAFGSAGWGPGQLADELMQGSWVIIPADPKLVFDDDRKGLWKEALARRTVPL